LALIALSQHGDYAFCSALFFETNSIPLRANLEYLNVENRVAGPNRVAITSHLIIGVQIYELLTLLNIKFAPTFDSP